MLLSPGLKANFSAMTSETFNGWVLVLDLHATCCLGGEEGNSVLGFWGRGKVKVALMFSILCVFYLLSFYSNSHPQTSRANSTCPTRLSARWCEAEKEGEFNIKTCSFFRDKQDGPRGERCITALLLHNGSIIDENYWATSPLWWANGTWWWTARDGMTLQCTGALRTHRPYKHTHTYTRHSLMTKLVYYLSIHQYFFCINSLSLCRNISY